MPSGSGPDPVIVAVALIGWFALWQSVASGIQQRRPKAVIRLRIGMLLVGGPVMMAILVREMFFA